MCGKNISVSNILFTMRLIMSQEGRTFFVLQPINCTEPVHTRLGNLTWLTGGGGAYTHGDEEFTGPHVHPDTVQTKMSQ